jgi:hypothetical protein
MDFEPTGKRVRLTTRGGACVSGLAPASGQGGSWAIARSPITPADASSYGEKQHSPRRVVAEEERVARRGARGRRRAGRDRGDARRDRRIVRRPPGRTGLAIAYFYDPPRHGLARPTGWSVRHMDENMGRRSGRLTKPDRSWPGVGINGELAGRAAAAGGAPGVPLPRAAPRPGADPGGGRDSGGQP